ncbi:15822_t:CDS:2 [Entrophospora sp. SA101]|nr:15822_t:CDS:2 [Entrophospora sp. SA101]
MGFNMLSECLKNVFSWLEDDKVTLYSSILVNRTWCRTATPYLWKNPFKLVSHENVYKLICIYFKSMSSEIFIDDRCTIVIKSIILLTCGAHILSLMRKSIGQAKENFAQDGYQIAFLESLWIIVQDLTP